MLKRSLPAVAAQLREGWLADAEDLVDDLLDDAVGGTLELDAVPQLAEAFPLRVFPDAVGIPKAGRQNLLPYGDHLFNAFGPTNDLVEKGAPRVPELAGWVNAQCTRDVLDPDGFGAQIWAASDRGDITPAQAPLVVRSLLSAGVDTTVHGLSAVLYGRRTRPAAAARRAHAGACRVRRASRESPVDVLRTGPPTSGRRPRRPGRRNSDVPGAKP